MPALVFGHRLNFPQSGATVLTGGRRARQVSRISLLGLILALRGRLLSRRRLAALATPGRPGASSATLGQFIENRLQRVFFTLAQGRSGVIGNASVGTGERIAAPVGGSSRDEPVEISFP